MSNGLKVNLRQSVRVDNNLYNNKFFSVANIDNTTVLTSWTNTNNNDDFVYNAEVNLNTNSITQRYPVNPSDNADREGSYVIRYANNKYVTFYYQAHSRSKNNDWHVYVGSYQLGAVSKDTKDIASNHDAPEGRMSVVNLSNNRFFVSWVGYNSKLYAQMVSVSGSDSISKGDQDIIRDISSAITIENVSVSDIESNRVAVTWLETSASVSQVRLQTYRVTGDVIDNPSTLVTVNEPNTLCRYRDSKVAYIINKILVTWTSYCGAQVIYGQYLDRNLNKQGNVFQINGVSDVSPLSADIIVTRNSEFLISWQSTINTLCSLNVKIFNPNTLAASQAATFLSNINCAQNSYAIDLYDNNGFVVFYKTSATNPLLYVNWYSYTKDITDSISVSNSISSTEELSASKSNTNSISQSISETQSQTLSSSFSNSISSTEELSSSMSNTASVSTSLSADTQTISTSGSLSADTNTQTISISESSTAGTTTQTVTNSGSQTLSTSGTLSNTASVSTSLSADTQTISISESSTAGTTTQTITNSGSQTLSTSGTLSNTASVSTSLSADTQTISTTGSLSADTNTQTISASESSTAGTTTQTVTMSGSQSESLSASVSDTVSHSPSQTSTIQCQRSMATVEMHYRNIQVTSYDTSFANTYIKKVVAHCRNDIDKEIKCNLDLRFDNPNKDQTTSFHDIILKNGYTIDGSHIFIDNECIGREIIAQMYSAKGYMQTHQEYYDTREEVRYSWNTTVIPRSYCISPWNVTKIGEIVNLKLGPGQCVDAALIATFIKGIKVHYQSDVEIFGYNKFNNQLKDDALDWAVSCLIKNGITYSLQHNGTKAVFGITGVITHEALADVIVKTSGCNAINDINMDL